MRKYARYALIFFISLAAILLPNYSYAYDVGGKFGIGFNSETAFFGMGLGSFAARYYLTNDIGIQIGLAGFYYKGGDSDLKGYLPSAHIITNIIKRDSANIYINAGGGPAYLSGGGETETGGFGKLGLGIEYFLKDFQNAGISVEFGGLGLSIKDVRFYSPYIGLGLIFYLK